MASISAIEQIHSSQQSISRTSISILVALRLIPNAVFSNIGGVLADSFDRRQILLVLDVLGAVIAWLFTVAYQCRSINALYAATMLQMTVAAIYEPSRSALTPMLLDEESLKKAYTLTGLGWSVMASVGSSLGGFAVEWVGIDMCFVIDSLTYLMSAFFVWKIQGDYLAADETNTTTSNAEGELSILMHDTETIVTSNTTSEKGPFQSLRLLMSMTVDGFNYLRSKPWGPFVFLKCCAALIYGAADVLNVSFSERGVSDVGRDSAYNLEGSSRRLGVLFAFVGLGCFFGPIAIEPFTHMNETKSLERACWGSYLLMAVGCWGLSRFEGVAWICVFTAVRSSGSSVICVYSSLLLQVS